LGNGLTGNKQCLTDLSTSIIIFGMKLFNLCLTLLFLTLAACTSSNTSSATKAELFVDIVSVAQSPNRIDDAIISVKTSPGAECTIVIASPSGSVNDPRLTTKTADKKGNVSWTMRLDTTGSSGAYVFTVTAALNGITQTGVNSFQLNQK
jgi:hypothetical protein